MSSRKDEVNCKKIDKNQAVALVLYIMIDQETEPTLLLMVSIN